MAEKPDLYVGEISEEDSSEDDGDIDDESTPNPRFWHFSQLVEGNVYIGGGNIPKYKSRKARAHLTTTIEKFDVKKRAWQQLETTGKHHPGLTAVACASFGKYLFAYGGNNAVGGLNAVLSQLDLDTLTWSELSPETAEGPMKKDASGMVHFGEDSLAVMCGYVDANDPTKYNGGSSDRGSRFIMRRESSSGRGGWTNEMHIFNHKFKDGHSGPWTSFSFSGPRPPPCADFSLTSVDLYRAILYGGHRATDEESCDHYLIDFDKKAIMKVQQRNKEDKWPQIRMGQHAACCLDFNTENPHLLISGGRLKYQLPPKDIWILNLAAATWMEIKLPNDIQNQLGRWGHTFTAIPHSEGLVEVIMFGGCPGLYEVTWDVYKRKDFGRLSFPVSFIFGILGEKWSLLDIINCNSRWTSKTRKLMPFDLGSHIMLDVLYSMEQDKIPVLTELINNKKIRSTVCSENSESLYKWPTFTKPSMYEPTWEKLCLFLQLIDMNNLAKIIKRYLKKKKDFVLQGVKVCGKTNFEITPSSTQPLEWEEYGLKLYPQRDSLPAGVDKVTITVLASIAGQYMFPENLHPTSAVFWLRCLPYCAFTKPIRIHMEHCANSDSTTNLIFARASCSQKQLPYAFKQLEGGLFSGYYGTIEVNRFSGLAVCQQGSNERKYYASQFHLGQQVVPDTIHIALTWNTRTHIAVVKDDYKQKNAREVSYQVIAFETESYSITLDIPMEGKNIDGWKLVPLIYPEITKAAMDEFEPGQGTPCFQLRVLKAQINPFIRRKGLFHQLLLRGAKRPNNIFSVIIPVEDTVPLGASSDSEDDCVERDSVRPSAKRMRLEPAQKPNYNITASTSTAAQQPIKMQYPDLKFQNLMVFKWRNKRGEMEKFKVIPQILNKWKEIGSLIGITYQQLEAWGNDGKKDANDCCRAVLNHWLSCASEDYPATWEGLCEILEDCELGQVATNLRVALQLSKP